EPGVDGFAVRRQQIMLLAGEIAGIVSQVAAIGGDGVFGRTAFGAHHFEKRVDQMAASLRHGAAGSAAGSSAGTAVPGRAGWPPESRSRAGMRMVTSLGVGSTKATRANMPA